MALQVRAAIPQNDTTFGMTWKAVEVMGAAAREPPATALKSHFYKFTDGIMAGGCRSCADTVPELGLSLGHKRTLLENSRDDRDHAGTVGAGGTFTMPQGTFVTL